MRKRFVLVIALIAVMAMGLMSVDTASATVHPIQSGDCSGPGSDPFSPAGGDPPGITGQSDPHAGNFAKPVFATGVLVGFDSEGNPIIDPTNPALNGDNGNCPNGSSEF